MPIRNTRRLTLFALATVLTISLGWLIAVAGGASKWELSRENGLMEDLQAVLLAGAFALFLVKAIGERAEKGARLVAGGLALLMLNFVLREFDVRELALPGWLLLVFEPRVRNLWLGAAWAVAAALALRERRELWRAGLNWLGSPGGWLFIAGGFFYLSAKLFDSALFGLAVDDNQLMEELLEVDAAWLLLLSALQTLRFERSGR